MVSEMVGMGNVKPPRASTAVVLRASSRHDLRKRPLSTLPETILRPPHPQVLLGAVFGQGKSVVADVMLPNSLRVLTMAGAQGDFRQDEPQQNCTQPRGNC